MHATNIFLATYAFAEVALALNLPFGWTFPWVNAQLSNNQIPLALSVEHEEPEFSSNRIAIVGAGAAGSSAAFWIGKAKERWGLDIEVDIFESSDYVGGRSTTVHPYNDPRLEVVEIGGSVFIEDNKNLWRASSEFGLNLTEFTDSDSTFGSTLGIWDGKEFVLRINTTGRLSQWWNTIKVLWRYGFNAPRKTNALVQSVLKRYLTLYSSEVGTAPWGDVATISESLGYTELTNTTGAEYLRSRGVSDLYINEIVESVTRVNYGQNVDKIHGLETFVSLLANTASQVVNGNWQLFDQFIKRSNASLYLNTTVTSISQKAEDQYVLHTTSANTNEVAARTYRSVILAAPYHSTGLTLKLLDESSKPNIPPQPYIHLYVTLLSTPNPYARTRYFGLADNDAPPNMVLTTWERERTGAGPERPEFNSASYHGRILNKGDRSVANLTDLGVGSPQGRDEAGEEWVVKIFSDHPVEDSFLRKVFGRVGWVVRKEWDSYPVLPPTDTFPPVKLAKGLYYVNAFEPFMSTMETETIASRNIVELLLREEHDASICKPGESTAEPGPDFVYGFDC